MARSIACLTSALFPLWLAAAVDLAFPFVLGVVAAREIVAAGNWRNRAMPVPIVVLGCALRSIVITDSGGR
jgi:uncharacterized protein involved in response to NO